MNDKEPVVMDIDACADFIVNKTGIQKQDVLAVLDAETEYMQEIGIIELLNEN